jgi:phosphopantetheinyl transferase
LKKQPRRLPGGDKLTSLDEIITIQANCLPRCHHNSTAAPMYCTASHDSRFAVAAASEHQAGIDVDEIPGLVLTGRHLYMHEEEIAMADAHHPGQTKASVRILSIKEAAAKALGINLAEAWRRTHVNESGNEKAPC